MKDYDSSKKTPTDLETQCRLQEIKENKRTDQAANNNTISIMEAQLQKLVKAVNDATDATTK